MTVDGSRDLTFTNITFEYATWSRPSGPLGYVEQQSGALVYTPNMACDYPGNNAWDPMTSNVLVSHARGVTFRACTFRHLGAGGVTLANGTHDTLFTRCRFDDISGTSVQIGGYLTHSITDPEMQEMRNTVSDCVITNVATEFHGTSGIQAGYTIQTRIVHNNITNLTYSGVSIGWGWADPPSYARDNVVSYNVIHDYKLQEQPVVALGDGGGIYALGPQPNSSMVGNWISRMGSGRGGGGYYPDEGSAYWTIDRNVFSDAAFCQDACEWLHIWTSSIHDITVSNCFTDTAVNQNHGTNTTVTNITLVTNGQWPPEAVAIMEAAGVRA